MQLTFKLGSRVADIYGTPTATEQYNCNFGINPDYIEILKQGPMLINGVEDDIWVIEWPDHRFIIGTLFVPQARSIL